MSATMQGRAPAAIPRATRHCCFPSFHIKTSARPATIADAGAEGYSVTVAHPAARPSASAHDTSAAELTAVRKPRVQAKANTRHAPASACPQNNVAYAHIGVARLSARAANAAALRLLPSRREIQKRHAHAA